MTRAASGARGWLLAAIAAVGCERARPAGPDFDHPEQLRATYDRSTSCALSRGVVACKGDNTRGLVGGGDARAKVKAFRRVALPARIADLQITPTSNAACALGVDGELWCWGINLGLLGTTVPLYRGADPERSIAEPTRVAGVPALQSIVLGAIHACAVDRDGAAYCWGDNRGGQVADPHARPDAVVLTPQRIDLPAPVRQLYLQDVQSCALLENQELHCWGGAFVDAAGARPLYGPTKLAAAVTAVHIDIASEQTCIDAGAGAACWSVRDRVVERAIADLLRE